MTTINDIADIARILKEQPEWRDTIRGILLGQELLELPEKFAEFAQITNRNFQLVYERLGRLETDLAEFVQITSRNFQLVYERLGRLETDLAEFVQITNRNFQLVYERLDRLETDLAEFIQITNRNFQLVYERLDRLETDLASLHVKVNRIEGKLDNALGITYEFKVDKNIRSLVGHMNLRRTKVVKSSITGITREFEDLLDEAEDNGLITAEQSNEIMRADIICVGRNQDDGSNQYVAGEISITIGNSDITRSARRATILSSIIGQTARPAVFGASIDDDRAALAATHGVTVLLLPND